MQWLSLTLPDLHANLALDEALLLDAEEGRGPEVLRLWEWATPAVVLGAAGRIADDVEEAICQRDGVPLARRSSGGGTVLLGTGCLLYSLVLAYDRAEDLTQIGSSYRYILDITGTALRERLFPVELAGISDLTSAGRKFSGNAQQRKRTHLLHHGTLLYRFDLHQVGRYLRQPPRQPDYRRHRDHDAFLMNLPLGREALVAALCDAWGAHEEMMTYPADQVRKLVAGKYELESWIRRR